jgi:hypothetical protein
VPIRIAATDSHLTLSWMDRDIIGARGRLTTSLRDRRMGAAPARRIDLSLDDRRWSLATDSGDRRALTLAGSAGGTPRGNAGLVDDRRPRGFALLRSWR